MVLEAPVVREQQLLLLAVAVTTGPVLPRRSHLLSLASCFELVQAKLCNSCRNIKLRVAANWRHHGAGAGARGRTGAGAGQYMERRRRRRAWRLNDIHIAGY